MQVLRQEPVATCVWAVRLRAGMSSLIFAIEVKRGRMGLGKEKVRNYSGMQKGGQGSRPDPFEMLLEPGQQTRRDSSNVILRVASLIVSRGGSRYRFVSSRIAQFKCKEGVERKHADQKHETSSPDMFRESLLDKRPIYLSHRFAYDPVRMYSFRFEIDISGWLFWSIRKMW